jgi:hypothetical protein
MVRTLSAALAALMVSAMGLSTVSAQPLPGLPGEVLGTPSMISTQDVLDQLRLIDPNVRAETKPNGDVYYALTVSNRILVVAVTKTEIGIVSFLSKPVNETGVALPVRFEIDQLNRQSLLTKFVLAPIGNGKVAFAGVRLMSRNSTKIQIQDAVNAFVTDLNKHSWECQKISGMLV